MQRADAIAVSVPAPPSGVAAAATALVFSAMAMGMSPVFVRLADVGPFTSAFWRVGLALPLLWAWMRIEERKTKGGRLFSPAIILSGLAFSGDLFFWHLAVFKTTVANATFFAVTAPVWVVIFGWLWSRQKVGGAVLAGLGLCLLGGVALVAQSFQINAGRVSGDVCGIVTAIFFGLYFLTVKAARGAGGAARVTFGVTIVTAAILLVVALVAEHRFWPRSPGGWAALFAMAWISHAGGQGLLSMALGRLPPVFSSLVIFLEAIAAAAMGWLVLNEQVTLVQGLGGIFIVLGIWIARPRPGARQDSRPCPKDE